MNERDRSATTQDAIRRNNLSRLLGHLHGSGSATRSELVSLTGLNRSTVGALVGELVDLGLVSEEAGSADGVGRPSLTVSVIPESAVVLAFDLRVERTVGALVGLGGRQLHTIERRHQRSGFSPQFAAGDIVELAIELLAQAAKDSAWVGTAVCLPGVVANPGGMVRFAPNLGWTNVSFGDEVSRALEARFGSAPSTVIGNDADLGALGECVRGAAVGAKDVVYVAGAVGIGGGIVLDGRLLEGAGGFGGEVGHMKVNSPGKPCRCGASGCWETEIGLEKVVLDAGLDPASAEIDDVIARADAGDDRARVALEEARAWLGVGLGNLTNMLNPECVVLSGHLARLVEEGMLAQDALLGGALEAPRGQVRILTSSPGVSSPLVGAAERAFEGLLFDPATVVQGAPRVAA